MRMARVVALLACLFLLLEVGLGLVAWRSKAKALQLLQTIDRFELGITSKAEAKSEMRRLGLNSIEEACSSIYSPCQGLGVGLVNYPMPFGGEIPSMLEYAVARISIFRPTYLSANCYFYGNHLASVAVEFSTDRAAISSRLDSTELGQEAGSEWRLSNRDGEKTFVRILDHHHQRGVSLDSAKTFNLECMDSVRGCNIASELWGGWPRSR